jgi:hypothetical protein
VGKVGVALAVGCGDPTGVAVLVGSGTTVTVVLGRVGVTRALVGVGLGGGVPGAENRLQAIETSHATGKAKLLQRRRMVDLAINSQMGLRCLIG